MKTVEIQEQAEALRDIATTTGETQAFAPHYRREPVKMAKPGRTYAGQTPEEGDLVMRTGACEGFRVCPEGYRFKVIYPGDADEFAVCECVPV